MRIGGVLAGLVLIVILLTVGMYFAAQLNSLSNTQSVVQSKSSSDIYLSKAPKTTQAPPPAAAPIPKWMLAIIPMFAVIQAIPVVIAAGIANTRTPTMQISRQVEFLCEIPMFLGLLGSLIGVCLTQFLTGSVAAPLAYLTTISGIVIHLFAKLAVPFVEVPNETQRVEPQRVSVQRVANQQWSEEQEVVFPMEF